MGKHIVLYNSEEKQEALKQKVISPLAKTEVVINNDYIESVARMDEKPTKACLQ